MEPVRTLNETGTDMVIPGALVEDRLEALRALIELMQREVESIDRSLPEASPRDEGNFSLSGEVRRFEADLIHRALIRTRGRQRLAAELLGVKFTTLNAKIKKYEIDCRLARIESRMVS